jgi:ADP-ribose pyrophosphatase
MIIVQSKANTSLEGALPLGRAAALLERSLSVAAGYPARAIVPSSQRLWERDCPNYNPPFYESPRLAEQDRTKNPAGWADPANVTPEEFLLWKKTAFIKSYEGEIRLDNETGRPLNPLGRVGIQGRGTLGKWGPNHAADALVTRINAESGLLEILLIQRASGEWAIPGGMLDPGEDALTAARRELKEEAGIDVDQLTPTPVYQGIGDGPRLTDNAWVETCAFHFHLQDTRGQDMAPAAGKDEQGAEWKVFSPELISSLYANHGELVAMMISQQRNRAPAWLENVSEQLELIVHIPTLTDFSSLRGRIGILGGSFDPIHPAHIEIAKIAKEKNNLAAVIFIPAAQNPLKQNHPGALSRERLDMATLALSGSDGLFVSPIEIRKEGYSYTIETLRSIKEALPEDENKIFMIIGADCLPQLPEWKDINEIMDLAQVVPIGRPGVFERFDDCPNLSRLYERFGNKTTEQLRQHFLVGINEPLSSTDVRQAIKERKGQIKGISNVQLAYIYEHTLYQ